MKAVIVAAGRGKRMMPLTANTPKPLLRLHGVPIVEYLLRGLRWAGVREIVFVTRYLGEQIEETFGDGSFLGLSVSYVTQSGPNGTGSACLSVRDAVGDEPFMLLWGDVLMDTENYRRILAKYTETPCDLLSGLNRLDDPSSGASVEVEGDRIVRIEEKPAPGQARSNWNQAGLFVCTREMFRALDRCGLSSRGEVEFTSGVQALIESGRDVRWMPIEGFWSDVGTPETLAAYNADPSIASLLRS